MERAQSIDKDQEREKAAPVWIEQGNPPRLIEEMSEGEILDALEKADQWIGNHRRKIASHSNTIFKLMSVKEDLGRELKERGINVLVPEIQVVNEEVHT